jgi:hypothetical protein
MNIDTVKNRVIRGDVCHCYTAQWKTGYTHFLNQLWKRFTVYFIVIKESLFSFILFLPYFILLYNFTLLYNYYIIKQYKRGENEKENTIITTK